VGGCPAGMRQQLRAFQVCVDLCPEILAQTSYLTFAILAICFAYDGIALTVSVSPAPEDTARMYAGLLKCSQQHSKQLCLARIALAVNCFKFEQSSTQASKQAYCAQHIT